jgi:serine protease
MMGFKQYEKLLIIVVLFGLTILQGCGGGDNPGTGTVTGKVIWETESAAFHLSGTYPVIPLRRSSPTLKSATMNQEKIIRFRPGLQESEIIKWVTDMGGQLKSKIYGTQNSYVVTMAPTNLSLKIARNDSNIESITDNTIFYASTIPHDTLYNYQWGCRMMYFPDAWDLQKGENRIPPITVAVLDTGVRMTHKDLQANLIIPTDICNFINNSNNPTDDYGHGTHVAGIISAVSNNNLCVTGMAWNVKILPVKVLNSNGEGTFAQIIAGINYAVAKGAKVINMSLGGTVSIVPQDFIDAFNNAATHNVTIIAAAGNENRWVNFPASYPGVVAVAALGPDGQRAPYSNYGPEIMVCAPGGADSIADPPNEMIVSTFYQSDTSYAYMSGTSMATPHVTGLVALIYSQIPGISPAQIIERLRTHTVDKGTTGFDNYYGYGMPDAFAALHGQPTQLPEIQVHVVSRTKMIELTQYPDGLGNYSIEKITAGDKYICAFLDKNRNGQVDFGDLFGYQSVTVEIGTTIPNIDITLSAAQITPKPSLADFLRSVLP